MATTQEAQASEIGLDEGRAVQTYETTLYADNVPPVRFITIPSRALIDEARGDLSGLLDMFGLETSEEFAPADLPMVLWRCLNPERPPPDASRDLWPERERRTMEFIEQLIYLPCIPFESSEQGSQSLGSLMTKGATTGAGVGALVSVGPHAPIIVITVPAGFVIGGLLGALTHALGVSIDDRVRDKLRRKPSADEGGA